MASGSPAYPIAPDAEAAAATGAILSIVTTGRSGRPIPRGRGRPAAERPV